MVITADMKFLYLVVPDDIEVTLDRVEDKQYNDMSKPVTYIKFYSTQENLTKFAQEISKDLEGELKWE